MEDLKYFCSHLFTSLSFDQKGQVRVCCNNYEIPEDKDGNPRNSVCVMADEISLGPSSQQKETANNES